MLQDKTGEKSKIHMEKKVEDTKKEMIYPPFFLL
jgi:hypothetical protein